MLCKPVMFYLKGENYALDIILHVYGIKYMRSNVPSLPFSSPLVLIFNGLLKKKTL